MEQLQRWRGLPRRTRRIEVALAVVTGLIALAGFLAIEAGEDTEGIGSVLLFGAMGVLVPAAALNRCLARPAGVRLVLGGILRAHPGDPIVPRFRQMGAPGLVVWLTPVALLPLELLLLPIGDALQLDDVDPSMPWLMTLLTEGELLLGLVVWMIVVLPLLLLGIGAIGLLPGHRHVEARRAAENRLAVLFACILLSTVVFAILLVLAAPGPDDASTHEANVLEFLALLGLDPSVVQHPVLLWCARGAALAVVLSLAGLLRTARRAKRDGSITDLNV